MKAFMTRQRMEQLTIQGEQFAAGLAAIDEAKRILAETEPTKHYSHVPPSRLAPSEYASSLAEALENFLKD